MNGVSREEKIHILYQLKALCTYVANEEPKRRALTNDALERGIRSGRYIYYPKDIPRELREGIVFYSSGWGWRLRKNWELVLEGKLAECEGEAS